MELFEDVALFNEGVRRFIDYRLPGAELQLWEQFFAKPESDGYYRLLKETTPWQQRVRKMYDKTVLDPRLTAFYGGEKGHAWTAELLAIKARVEKECGVVFDRVLLNYYRDGNDSVAWHSDTLAADGKHHPIASVTFGETRVFKVRHRSRKDIKPLDIPLTHGSFLLMGASMQDQYEHHVPKTSRKVGARINLTFRISEPAKPIYFATPHQENGTRIANYTHDDK